jgi:hypothetical protein
VEFRSRTTGWFAVVVAAGLWSGTAASAAAHPATLAVTSQPIVSLAAGAGRVAFRTHFATGFGSVCNSVHVLSVEGLRARERDP